MTSGQRSGSNGSLGTGREQSLEVETGGVSKESNSLIGGGSGKTAAVKVPETPNYEAERKKAEEEATKKRSALAGKGMAGTILGGSFGDDSNVNKKKLLGE